MKVHRHHHVAVTHVASVTTHIVTRMDAYHSAYSVESVRRNVNKNEAVLLAFEFPCIK